MNANEYEPDEAILEFIKPGDPFIEALEDALYSDEHESDYDRLALISVFVGLAKGDITMADIEAGIL